MAALAAVVTYSQTLSTQFAPAAVNPHKPPADKTSPEHIAYVVNMYEAQANTFA